MIRRVEKIGKNGSTRYLWDGAVIVEQTDSNEKVSVWEYEDSSFRPLAKIEKGQVFAVVNDRSGKLRELIDGKGATAWHRKTNLWGTAENVVESGTKCELGFQGQWFEEESGLHYNRHRYYDSETGRYLSPDPIGLEGGLNAYENEWDEEDYEEPMPPEMKFQNVYFVADTFDDFLQDLKPKPDYSRPNS